MSKKILIIEDEKDLADVLGEKLTRQNYEVVFAPDGEDGLAKIKSERPDLILLDIMMPKKDGMEVLKDMQQEGLSDIPVIVISNSGQPVEIDKVLELGVKDYLIKTEFDPEEVLAKVEAVLGQAAPVGSNGSKDNGAAKSAGNGLSNKTTILVVEDDKFLHELVTKKLIKQGYNVSGAESGSEALKKIKEEKIDLVLLDLILPDINGFEVLKQVKQDASEQIKNIPVVILSNLGQTEEIEKGINLGAEDFLVKAHFTPGEIVEKIEKILAKKHQ